ATKYHNFVWLGVRRVDGHRGEQCGRTTEGAGLVLRGTDARSKWRVSPARRRVVRDRQHGDETVSEGLNADDRRTALSIPDDAGAAPAMGRERATPQPPGLGAAPRAARASDRNHRAEAAGWGSDRGQPADGYGS